MEQFTFDAKLLETLKDNLSLSLTVGEIYDYGDQTKVLTVQIKFKGETICHEEVSL